MLESILQWLMWLRWYGMSFFNLRHLVQQSLKWWLEYYLQKLLLVSSVWRQSITVSLVLGLEKRPPTNRNGKTKPSFKEAAVNRLSPVRPCQNGRCHIINLWKLFTDSWHASLAAGVVHSLQHNWPRCQDANILLHDNHVFVVSGYRNCKYECRYIPSSTLQRPNQMSDIL